MTQDPFAREEAPWGYLYRYEGHQITDGFAIDLKEYRITGVTDKTFIIDYWEGPKRVLKGDGKRFAHEKKEWAWYSFQRRNKTYCQHLERSLKAALEIREYIRGRPPIEQEIWIVNGKPQRLFGDIDG